MAVNLDQILFYNPPQPKARRANLPSEGAVGYSSQHATCIDLGSQQDSLGSIEISDDEDYCAAVRGPSTPGHGGPREDAATSSASVVPGAPTSVIQVPSARSSSHPIPPPIPATTSAPLGDNIYGDETGRPICESLDCGRPDSSTAPGITDTCHSVNSPVDRCVVHVGPSSLRTPRTTSTNLGQTTTVGTNARVKGRLALSTQPGPCVTSHVEVAVETADSNPSFTDESTTSRNELFPNLSSLSGSPLMKNPRNPSHISHSSVSLPGRTAPLSALPCAGAILLGATLSSPIQPQALPPPIALPGQSLHESPISGPTGNRPVTPPGQPENNSPALPPPKRGRHSDRSESRPQRCSARLRSAIHQAPPTYHEVSDSSSDASGGEEGDRSPDSERECAPGSKRRRSSRSSEAVGPRSRRRVSQPSNNMTSSRHVRTRGIISPPLSRYPSEPGSVEDSPVITFKEWPLRGATLKRIMEGGVATFQLQFSWDLCTGSGTHEKAPKDRTPLSAKGRGPFTADEDALLIGLKEQRISWKEIHGQFAAMYPGRTLGALQVRYCTKLKDRNE